MNGFGIWQRLVWKDLVTIRPLLLAIGLSIVAMPFIAALAKVASDDSGSSAVVWSIMLWILLPNLMAIGLPPMLIGTEEETGTLGWLRTLPIRWQTIADSKFVTAALCTLAAWLLASLALWISTSSWGNVNSEPLFGGSADRARCRPSFLFHMLVVDGGHGHCVRHQIAGGRFSDIVANDRCGLVFRVLVRGLLAGFSLHFVDRLCQRNDVTVGSSDCRELAGIDPAVLRAASVGSLSIVDGTLDDSKSDPWDRASGRLSTAAESRLSDVPTFADLRVAVATMAASPRRDIVVIRDHDRFRNLGILRRRLSFSDGASAD